MGDSSDDDDLMCPLCVEELDLSDKNFLPCKCGYRVCMWCWHHIKEDLNGLCPACRTPYGADPHAFSAVEAQEIIQKNKADRALEKAAKKQQSLSAAQALAQAQQQHILGPRQAAATAQAQAQAASAGGGSGAAAKQAAPSSVDRRQLHNYRVVQRNLVYVIGLPGHLGNEDRLRQAEFFGQYGKIGKVVIHKSHAGGGSGGVSAYITFVYKDDAKACIQALEGHWADNHLLRASFGTTKYCNSFIRGASCSNPDCVYLHEMGNDEDRYTKAEIQAGHSKLNPVPGQNQQLVTGNGGPSGTGKRPSGEPFLPAPVFIKDIDIAVVAKPVLPRANSWNTQGQGLPAALSGDSSSKRDQAKATTATTTGLVVATAEREQVEMGAATAAAERDAQSEREAAATATSMELDNPPPSAPAPSRPLSKKEQKRLRADEEREQRRLRAEEAANDRARQKQQQKQQQQQQQDEEDQEMTKRTQADDHSDAGAAAAAGDNDQYSQKNGFSSSSSSASIFADGSSFSGLSFNGLGLSAVFTVPVSSLAPNAVWGSILGGTGGTGTESLAVNPYTVTGVTISELFDLTLPPVDAVGLPVWPMPASFYNNSGSKASGGGGSGLPPTGALAST